MRARTLCPAALVFFFIPGFHVLAENPSPEAVLTAIQGNLDQVQCLRARFRIESELSDKYLKENNMLPEQKTTSRECEITYSGDKWRMDVITKQSSGDVANSLASAFDGKTLYSFDRATRYMNVTTNRNQLDGWLYFTSVVLAPYAFLNPQAGERNGLVTDLETVKKSLFDFSRATIRLANDNIEISIPGTNFTDDVVFSAENLAVPKSFRRVGKDNFGIVEYSMDIQETMTVLGDDTSKPGTAFMKTAVLKLSRNGAVQRTDHIKIQSIELNQCDDNIFSLDVAEADAIYDMDSEKYIAVPK